MTDLPATSQASDTQSATLLPHRPTPDLAAVARERAVQSRRAQGLPDHITDSATLDQVAQLVLANRLPARSAQPPP
jgi:hypothetical protein